MTLSARGLCKGKLWSMKLEQTRLGGFLECERHCRQTRRGLYHYITPALEGDEISANCTELLKNANVALSSLFSLFHIPIDKFFDCYKLFGWLCWLHLISRIVRVALKWIETICTIHINKQPDFVINDIFRWRIQPADSFPVCI